MEKGGRGDIIVIGAGALGLASALALARDGWQVEVLEAAGVGAGASGGLVGALSPHIPRGWSDKKQLQLDALIGADAYWREVETLGGLAPGYARTGRWMPLTAPEAAARMAADGAEARRHWPADFTWEVVPAAMLPAWIDPEAAPWGAVHETLSARLHPRRALAALVAALEALGGRVRCGTEVSAIRPGCVDLAGAHLSTETIVIAAGTGGAGLVAPAMPGSAGLGVKGQAALLRPAGPPPPAMFYGDGLYVVPHDDGSVAVGSTSEKEFSDPAATDSQLDALIARAARLCPPLRGAAVLERWAGVRPRAPKADPLVGPVPGWPGVFVANGGFRTGFSFAPLIGAAIADLAAGRPSGLPARFTPAGHGLAPSGAALRPEAAPRNGSG